jgi:hypothetical protein
VHPGNLVLHGDFQVRGQQVGVRQGEERENLQPHGVEQVAETREAEVDDHRLPDPGLQLGHPAAVLRAHGGSVEAPLGPHPSAVFYLDGGVIVEAAGLHVPEPGSQPAGRALLIVERPGHPPAGPVVLPDHEAVREGFGGRAF